MHEVFEVLKKGGRALNQLFITILLVIVYTSVVGCARLLWIFENKKHTAVPSWSAPEAHDNTAY